MNILEAQSLLYVVGARGLAAAIDRPSIPSPQNHEDGGLKNAGITATCVKSGTHCPKPPQ